MEEATFRTIGTIFLIIVCIAIYFLPYLIAIRKKSERQTQIGLLNLFLGWTFIGWIIFLVMAVGKNKR